MLLEQPVDNISDEEIDRISRKDWKEGVRLIVRQELLKLRDTEQRNVTR